MADRYIRIPRAGSVSLVLAVVGLGALATVTTLQANWVANDYAHEEEVVAAVAATPTPPALPPVEGQTLEESRALASAATPTGVSEGRGRAPAAVGAGTQYPSFRPTTPRLPPGPSAPIPLSGVRDDGSLEIPDDPAVVGWWTGGALAGEPYGGTVIAGHVDSRRYGLGALAEMRDVRDGQLVVLGNARQDVTYRVSSITNVPQA